MVKVKHARTADCVVGGFRWHKTGEGVVGSLMLGLYDDEGFLHHVGVCGAFPMKMRKELVDEIAPWRENAAEGHPWAEWSGGPLVGNRWNAKKDQSFELLRPERVVEVAYEKLQGGRRFRHTAQFRHWRPDRDPASCTFDQLEVVVPQELHEVFAAT
jgi:ATP-dependent DNA ligase